MSATALTPIPVRVPVRSAGIRRHLEVYLVSSCIVVGLRVEGHPRWFPGLISPKHRPQPPPSSPPARRWVVSFSPRRVTIDQYIFILCSPISSLWLFWLFSCLVVLITHTASRPVLILYKLHEPPLSWRSTGPLITV